MRFITKRLSFLARLEKEGKLQFVQPNKDLKEGYIQRAKESLSSAKSLYKIGNLKDAVALSYYAMYHSLLALLFYVGIKSENHTASILILKEVLGLENNTIARAKAERIDKQYYVDFKVEKEEVSESIRNAEEFLNTITDFTAKLKNAEIDQCRKRLMGMLQGQFSHKHKRDSKG